MGRSLAFSKQHERTIYMSPTPNEVTLYLGESIGFWIQTAAIFLSAIGAIGVIRYNAFNARRRATIDHIIHQKANKDLVSAISEVYKLRNENVSLSQFSKDTPCTQRDAIIAVLNNQEFIALGIRRGAFEEKIYKELQFSDFKKLHSASSGFVAEIRNSKSNPKIYQEFDWLIDRWNKHPLKQIKDQRCWYNPARYIDL